MSFDCNLSTESSQLEMAASGESNNMENDEMADVLGSGVNDVQDAVDSSGDPDSNIPNELQNLQVTNTAGSQDEMATNSDAETPSNNYRFVKFLLNNWNLIQYLLGF